MLVRTIRSWWSTASQYWLGTHEGDSEASATLLASGLHSSATQALPPQVPRRAPPPVLRQLTVQLHLHPMLLLQVKPHFPAPTRPSRQPQAVALQEPLLQGPP
jgi:hypothetical protein